MDFYKNNKKRIKIFWAKDKKNGILKIFTQILKVKMYT